MPPYLSAQKAVVLKARRYHRRTVAVGRKTVVGRGVQDHRTRDVRQCGGQGDGVHAGAADVEVDGVGAAVAVRVGDGLAQRAGAAV